MDLCGTVAVILTGDCQEHEDDNDDDGDDDDDDSTGMIKHDNDTRTRL